MGRNAVKLNIPGGVLQKDLSEHANGAQRMVFFCRSLFDAVKQLVRSARLPGKQHTGFEKVYSAGQKRSMEQSTAVKRSKSARGTQGQMCPHFQCSSAAMRQ